MSDEGLFVAFLYRVIYSKELAAMTGEEFGGYIILAIWALMIWGAIRAFGFRRVALVALWFVVFALGIAFRSLSAVTTTRRYY